MIDEPSPEAPRHAERASLYRGCNAAFARWAAGHGVIRHGDETQVRVFEMASELRLRGVVPSADDVFRLLAAADRVTNAAMWLVVHSTYARNVYLDGRPLAPGDFKRTPEGHTGGALNMVPAYVGYLVANAIAQVTRSWIMGQGHCVAAIDATNVLVGNGTPTQEARYPVGDEGLSRFVRDFYSYALSPDGRPASPLGSHVSPQTAGGMLEGGYLGFAELQYVHVPLPGERLVAFLSDGAFEEQRGSDWAPRWWRAEDSGLVTPILIANGRRIDQRTTVAQQGGAEWLRRHLRLNGFDPIEVDGRDPAAIAWAIYEMESRLGAVTRARRPYPIPLPYAIAETVKGYGFPGAGTNAAHNLPLGTSPATDEAARRVFNEGAGALWVGPDELRAAVAALSNHAVSRRPREREHPCLAREIPTPALPPPSFRAPDGSGSAMAAIDRELVRVVDLNPGLRVRLGNPDELRSNGMNASLDRLRHRVTAPEAGVAEAIDGAVITALNEEAVVSAAFGNKGGLNLVVTYEAFAPKMLGAVRQELTFSRHGKDVGAPPRWISVPLVLTSHTWENGKNEQSHQDPTMAEALLGEMSDVSRVVFPADENSAVATLRAAYVTRGQVWTAIVAKRPVRNVFDGAAAESLVARGAGRVRGTGAPEERVLLVAVGAYQLEEALFASDRLGERRVPHAVVYLLEPGRFRSPRDAAEAQHTIAPRACADLFPPAAQVRVFLSHTRPEPLAGLLRPLDTGPDRTRFLGYVSRGGTLDTFGLLFANRCTWAHALAEVAAASERPLEELLSPEEAAAVRGAADPHLLDKRPGHGRAPRADAG